jgi:hypothetical protein
MKKTASAFFFAQKPESWYENIVTFIMFQANNEEVINNESRVTIMFFQPISAGT